MKILKTDAAIKNINAVVINISWNYFTCVDITVTTGLLT